MKKTFLFAVLILTQFTAWAKPETKRPNFYAFTRGVEAFENNDNQEVFDRFKKEIQENSNNRYVYMLYSMLIKMRPMVG